MLIVTRKPHEFILIGDRVTVRVVTIQNDVVELEVAVLNEVVKRESVKFDEEIQINEEIAVKVTEIISESRIRLGITAPRDVEILRIPRISDKN
jgi:sRNA-binding carbon storage regulator CsrA